MARRIWLARESGLGCGEGRSLASSHSAMVSKMASLLDGSVVVGKRGPRPSEVSLRMAAGKDRLPGSMLVVDQRGSTHGNT